MTQGAFFFSHLVSEAVRLLLVLGQLLLPLLRAAVGLLQGLHQLGVAVLQGEQLRLQVDLAHGPAGTFAKTAAAALVPLGAAQRRRCIPASRPRPSAGDCSAVWRSRRGMRAMMK